MSLRCLNENPQRKEIVLQFSSLGRLNEIPHTTGKSTFKSLLPQIIAALISGATQIVVGISLAYSAILIPQLAEEQNRTDITVIKVTKDENSWIASVLSTSSLVSALFGGFLLDYIGRLNFLKITAIPVVIGWILMATATNVSMLLVGRILTGICLVSETAAVTYVTEIANPDVRGPLVAITQVYISLGMVLTYLLGWLCHWRTLAWLSAGYTALSAILIIFIYESPPWLVYKGRTSLAKASLKWFNKYVAVPAYQTQPIEDVQLALLQKEKFLKQQLSSKPSEGMLKTMLKFSVRPAAYKPFLLLVGLFAVQQFSGIYITLFYAVVFVQSTGTDVNPYLASVSIGLMRVVMGLINIYLLQHCPKRSLLIYSAIGMAISMGVSGLFTNWILESKTDQSWVPIVMLMIYVLSSMMGLLSIPWIIMAEIFPLEIRGSAQNVAAVVSSGLMFSAIQSYYALSDLFGGVGGLQYFFALMSVAGLIFCYVFVPETNNKKLSEIEEYFNHHCTYLSVM